MATIAGSSRGATICEPMLTLPGAPPREAQLEGYRRYAALSDRWLGHFLDQRRLCPAADAPVAGERAA
jgi:hypothetical protein